MRLSTGFVLVVAASLGACGGPEGFMEGATDAFEGEPFDPSTCAGCPEPPPDDGPAPDDGVVFGYHVSCSAIGVCIDYFVPSAGEADRIKDECGAAGAEPSDAPCTRGDHLCTHRNEEMCTVTHTYGDLPDHDEACTRPNPDQPGQEGEVGAHCQ